MTGKKSVFIFSMLLLVICGSLIFAGTAVCNYYSKNNGLGVTCGGGGQITVTSSVREKILITKFTIDGTDRKSELSKVVLDPFDSAKFSSGGTPIKENQVEVEAQTCE